jgi:hypothetical protein
MYPGNYSSQTDQTHYEAIVEVVAYHLPI